MEEEGDDARQGIGLHRIADRRRIRVEQIAAKVEGVGESGFLAQVFERQLRAGIQLEPADAACDRRAVENGDGSRKHDAAGEAAGVEVAGKRCRRTAG